MQENKKARKRVVVVGAVIIAVILLVVPLLIHTAYTLESPLPFFESKWKAGDALTFYGSVVATAGTMAGVLLTVNYYLKKDREALRNSVLPDIVFDIRDNNEEKDPEGNHVILINGGEISCSLGLPNETPTGDELPPFKATDLYVLLRLSSVGKGTAQKLALSFYREGSAAKRGLRGRNLTPRDEDWYIFLVSCGDPRGVVGDYVLHWSYADIFGHQYEKTEKLWVLANTEGELEMEQVPSASSEHSALV
jgi:hypothetical protein